MLKSINHPNVIEIKEDNLETERNLPAFVMEFARRSLIEHLHAERAKKFFREFPVLPRSDAVTIVDLVLQGLESLHQNEPSIHHRDVNPSNVLLSGDRWVLAALGLAKFVSTAPASSSFCTTTRHGVGTQNYTAPEQFRNFVETDSRTDVYSVGVLIWELFTDLGPPMDRRELGLGTQLGSVIEKATSRDVEDRFQSISELRETFLSVV